MKAPFQKFCIFTFFGIMALFASPVFAQEEILGEKYFRYCGTDKIEITAEEYKQSPTNKDCVWAYSNWFTASGEVGPGKTVLFGQKVLEYDRDGTLTTYDSKLQYDLKPLAGFFIKKAMAAITHDATSFANYVAGTSVTISHTLTGSNPYIYGTLDVGTEASGCTPVTATWNGSAAEIVIDNVSFGTDTRIVTFQKLSPTTGTHDWVFTLGVSCGMGAVVNSYAGVAQTSAYANTNTSDDISGADASVDITRDQSDSVAISCHAQQWSTSTWTPGGSQTERGENGGAGRRITCTERTTGAGALTMLSTPSQNEASGSLGYELLATGIAEPGSTSSVIADAINSSTVIFRNAIFDIFNILFFFAVMIFVSWRVYKIL